MRIEAARRGPGDRALLGAHLDLYQVHSVTLESPALDDRGLLAALAELKQAGVCIGFSTSGPGQAGVIARALAVRLDGVRLFDAVQATWNLFERSAAALAEARAAGMGVIVNEALATGRLPPHNTDADSADGRAALQAEARRLGTPKPTRPSTA